MNKLKKKIRIEIIDSFFEKNFSGTISSIAEHLRSYIKTENNIEILDNLKKRVSEDLSQLVEEERLERINRKVASSKFGLDLEYKEKYLFIRADKSKIRNSHLISNAGIELECSESLKGKVIFLENIDSKQKNYRFIHFFRNASLYSIGIEKTIDNFDICFTGSSRGRAYRLNKDISSLKKDLRKNHIFIGVYSTFFPITFHEKYPIISISSNTVTTKLINNKLSNEEMVRKYGDVISKSETMLESKAKKTHNDIYKDLHSDIIISIYPYKEVSCSIKSVIDILYLNSFDYINYMANLHELHENKKLIIGDHVEGIGKKCDTPAAICLCPFDVNLFFCITN